MSADEGSVAAMSERITEASTFVVSNAGVSFVRRLRSRTGCFRFPSVHRHQLRCLLPRDEDLAGVLSRQHATSGAWLIDVIPDQLEVRVTARTRTRRNAGSKFGGIDLVQSFALELVEHG